VATVKVIHVFTAWLVNSMGPDVNLLVELDVVSNKLTSNFISADPAVFLLMYTGNETVAAAPVAAPIVQPSGTRKE